MNEHQISVNIDQYRDSDELFVDAAARRPSRVHVAFVLDPDGNNIEAVWHGKTARSAESIVAERKS
jgi:hypothetical protein